MIRSILLVFCMLVSSSLQAQCQNYPVKFTRFSLPTLWMEVLGQNKAFIFDSGMSRALSIEKSLFDKLISDQDVQLTNQLDIAGGASQVRKLENQSLTLAGHTFNNITIAEYKPWGLILVSHENDEAPIENTIGLGLFDSGLLYYSQSQSSLRFCEKGDTIELSDDIQWYPLIKDSEGVHFNVLTEQKSYNFVLDTASTVSLIKPQDDIKTAPCANHPKQSCSKLDSYGEFYVQDFPEYFESDGILGGNFFDSHDVIIDNMNQRLGLLKIENR